MTRRISVALVLGAALTGCTPSTTAPTDSVAAQVERLPRAQRCLRIDRIDNWRVIDSRQLIVYGPRREQAWHVRLIASCTRLRMSEVVGFRAIGASEICGDPGDDILVRGDRCPIRSMVPVSPAEVEMLFEEAKGHGDIGKLPPATPPEKTPK
jgi:hypothetical protein